MGVRAAGHTILQDTSFRLDPGSHVAIVGQNGTEEARAEIRDPGSPFIASVAYFPERFGEKLLSVAMSIKGDKVPLAIYIDNIVLAADNIDRYYPTASQPAGPADSALGRSTPDL